MGYIWGVSEFVCDFDDYYFDCFVFFVEEVVVYWIWIGIGIDCCYVKICVFFECVDIEVGFGDGCCYFFEDV